MMSEQEPPLINELKEQHPWYRSFHFDIPEKEIQIFSSIIAPVEVSPLVALNDQQLTLKYIRFFKEIQQTLKNQQFPRTIHLYQILFQQKVGVCAKEVFSENISRLLNLIKQK